MKKLLLILACLLCIGWKSSGGWDSGPVYSRYFTERAVTSDTITANESGKSVSVDCTTRCQFTLPTAEPGLSFTFVSEVAEVFDIDVATTADTIRYLSMSAGDKLTSPGAVSDSVELFSTQANYWNVKNMKGTWVDGN